jgi:hypothetical protein
VAQFVQDDAGKEADGGDCPHSERDGRRDGEHGGVNGRARTEHVVEQLRVPAQIRADEIGEQG